MIDHVQGLRREFALARAAVDDLDARVPSCPDWLVRDLLRHLGSVYRLFRRVADEGWMERPPNPEDDDRPDAADDGILRWTEEQFDLLVRALQELDPQLPRWNFSPGPQLAAFIPRRMHHETFVHRWDLQLVAGPPGPITEEVAVDGIREYLEVHVPRSGPWENAPIRVHTIVADGPTLELDLVDGALPTVHEPPRSGPDVAVAGAAPSLLLAWWGRTPLGELLRHGDPASLEEVRRFART